MNLTMKATRKCLGVTGLTVALLSALSAAILLSLLFSGHLSSPNYESFLNRQDAIMRAVLLISIFSFLAIPVAAFGFGQKRIVAVVVAFMTLIPMAWLFFVTSMARY